MASLISGKQLTGVLWNTLTGIPTTLSGHGITDGVSTGGSYADPTWLTSLAWSKVSGKPTTVSGYGISDGVSTGGSYANPSWIPSLAWSKITSTPTTVSGYGISDGVSTGGSYANPSWITSLAYAKLTGAPTVLTQRQDIFNPTAGQTAFTLSNTPSVALNVKVFLNGIMYSGRETAPAFSVSGTTLTWSNANAYSLVVGDFMLVEYWS